MKRLVLSAIVGLSLANATNLNIGISAGTGYIDSDYKNLIVKFEKNIKFFNVGGKFANSYLKGYISTIPSFTNLLNNEIVEETRIGIEKYEINNKNEVQAFVNYKALFTTKTHFVPEFSFTIGTKSLKASTGILYYPLKKLSFEYEIGKRYLYKTVENKKNTTTTTIYINYFF